MCMRVYLHIVGIAVWRLFKHLQFVDDIGQVAMCLFLFDLNRNAMPALLPCLQQPPNRVWGRLDASTMNPCSAFSLQTSVQNYFLKLCPTITPMGSDTEYRAHTLNHG